MIPNLIFLCTVMMHLMQGNKYATSTFTIVKASMFIYL